MTVGCSVDADGLGARPPCCAGSCARPHDLTGGAARRTVVDEVAAMCESGEIPDFVYTIPNFQASDARQYVHCGHATVRATHSPVGATRCTFGTQNPRGVVLSPSRRTQLLALANAYDFLVISDEPYSLLHYHGEPAPPLYTRCG